MEQDETGDGGEERMRGRSGEVRGGRWSQEAEKAVGDCPASPHRRHPSSGETTVQAEGWIQAEECRNTRGQGGVVTPSAEIAVEAFVHCALGQSDRRQWWAKRAKSQRPTVRVSLTLVHGRR